MANVTITVTPVPGKETASQTHYLGGLRITFAKLSIATGQTYSTTDRCVLVHTAGSDFSEHYTVRTIKDVVCDPIACNNVSYGVLVPVWDFANQKLKLFRGGDGGSTAPTGPLDEAEVANATALGSGTMSGNAVIYF